MIKNELYATMAKIKYSKDDLDFLRYQNFTRGYLWKFWSNKTLASSAKCYELYKRWFLIFSNVHLNFPHIRYENAQDVKFIYQNIARFQEKTGRAWRFVIFCDEMSVLFPAWDFKRFDYDLRNFFLQTRKLKTFFIGCAQKPRQTLKEFRYQISIWLYSTKFFWIPMQRVTELDEDGEIMFEKYVKNWQLLYRKVDSFYKFWIPSRHYKLYDTYQPVYTISAFKDFDNSNPLLLALWEKYKIDLT